MEVDADLRRQDENHRSIPFHEVWYKGGLVGPWLNEYVWRGQSAHGLA